ncbi:MAG TPA: hypothetical protein VK747_14900 [Blastocatellia bacterium]|nr:hypothetical protein [Blastocatellia bacterium]
MADIEQEIFDSALTDEPGEVQVEPVQTEQEPEPAVSRDEQGRFAPKPEEAEKPAKTEEREPGPPAWRLKEEADARRAAEHRASTLEAQLQQFLQQKEQKPAPDIFEDAPKFVDQRVGSQVDPIRQEIGQLREFYSQREAIRSHGQEKVKAAYDWIAQGMQSRDPERMAIYNRAMTSFDPYGEIVNSHAKQTVFEQIGSDPNAYVEKQLEEKLKDPTFAAKMLERIRGVTQQARPPGITQLPPSLGRSSSSASPREGDDEDNSDAGLFRQATR